MSVLEIFTPVIKTKKDVIESAKAIETAETVETAEVGEENKESKGEYPNLTRVPCIRYSITFWKKFVSVSVLLDLDSEVNAIHLRAKDFYQINGHYSRKN